MSIDSAISLLNELHKERISYDEYVLLYETITSLHTKIEEQETKIKKIQDFICKEIKRV